jgi:O-antigen/teichoic acid export membrane protein/4-amino-4-deoxy-L-arabinose transferase-like glycosyltransferase
MAAVIDTVEVDRSSEVGASSERRPSLPGPSRRRLGFEQLSVAAGQLGAGVGNLGFTLLAARILAPSDFARLSVFLGLYLILSLPATSLSAATALDPAQRDVLVRRVTLGGVAVAAVGAVMSPWIGPALHLPALLVVGLAAAVPAAGLLALERGRLYGRRDHRRVVASLLAEPAVRLSAGVLLATWTGAVGGAAGVVVAAYAALEVARSRRRRGRTTGRHFRLSDIDLSGARAAAPAPAGWSRAGWTAGAFALLAVVQNQDLVFANVLLSGRQAGLYAALSTLGGAAAFATITLPLVLLPRVARGDRRSLEVAVAIAVVIGAVAVAVGALASGPLVAGMFGARYEAISHLVVPYLAAMGLLGVARVLVAERCASGAPRAVTVIVAAAAAGQAAAIAVAGDRIDTIAMLTLATTSSLTLVLVAEREVRRRSLLRRLMLWCRWAATDRAMRILAVTVVAGLLVRLVVWRGIWLDEATSVTQVRMSFSGMISDLRDTDVHPPLYFSVLWVTVRMFGYGSMAIRIPSIVAGVLLIPAAFVTARDLWDRRTGLVAASFAAVGPILVWYSQEVRMYSMFMLFAVLAIWGQVRALRHGRPRDWAIYLLASAGLAWTEYFGIFQVVAQQLYFAWYLASVRRRRAGPPSLLLGWLAATGILIALMLPLAPFAWHQFAVNQNAGKGFGAPSQTSLAGTQSISVYTVLANLAWAVIGYHSASIMEALVALWPLGILLSLFILGRRASPSTKLVLTAAVVPALLLLGAGMEKRFLYDVRYMSGVVVALVLIAARMVTGSTKSVRMQVLGCVALVAVFTTGLVDEQFNGTNPRLYDFAGALGTINAEWKPGDLVVYAPGSIDAVLEYYSQHARTELLTSQVPAAPPGDAVFVLASPSLMNSNQPGQLRQLLVRLRQVDLTGRVILKSNVTVWTFIVPTAPLAAGPVSAGRAQ